MIYIYRERELFLEFTHSYFLETRAKIYYHLVWIVSLALFERLRHLFGA